jgi:hypothetical protein
MKCEYFTLLLIIYFGGGLPVQPYISAEMIINATFCSLFSAGPTLKIRGDFLKVGVKTMGIVNEISCINTQQSSDGNFGRVLI